MLPRGHRKHMSQRSQEQMLQVVQLLWNCTYGKHREYFIRPRLLTSLWNVSRDRFSSGRWRQDWRECIWHWGLWKTLFFNKCLQQAVIYTLPPRTKKNSWWIKTVRRDSELAPTSEVFELRGSEHRRSGCVGLTTVWHGDDEIQMMVWGWGGRGREDHWWRRPTLPDCPVALLNRLSAALWIATGVSMHDSSWQNLHSSKGLTAFCYRIWPISKIMKAWVPEHR